MPAAALAPVSADGRTVGAPGVITGTRLLVNLYEPSQVERAAGLTWTAWLVRAELMPVEALEGAHPRKPPAVTE